VKPNGAAGMKDIQRSRSGSDRQWITCIATVPISYASSTRQAHRAISGSRYGTLYGVSQGIRDGILKDVTDNFRQFEIGGHADKFVHHVVTDFFTQYGTVCLPNGSPAKLAVYFPQMNELQELRPVIDKALVEVGQSPAMCLVNTSDQHLTKQTDIDA
jgi:hypothetical protein